MESSSKAQSPLFSLLFFIGDLYPANPALLSFVLRQGFKNLKLWVNWFMVLIIISAVMTTYCVLLLVRI